jgi:hypothetical protein
MTDDLLAGYDAECQGDGYLDPYTRPPRAVRCSAPPPTAPWADLDAYARLDGTPHAETRKTQRHQFRLSI